jgi:hypothetical protein
MFDGGGVGIGICCILMPGIVISIVILVMAEILKRNSEKRRQS